MFLVHSKPSKEKNIPRRLARSQTHNANNIPEEYEELEPLHDWLSQTLSKYLRCLPSGSGYDWEILEGFHVKELMLPVLLTRDGRPAVLFGLSERYDAETLLELLRQYEGDPPLVSNICMGLGVFYYGLKVPNELSVVDPFEWKLPGIELRASFLSQKDIMDIGWLLLRIHWYLDKLFAAEKRGTGSYNISQKGW
ncbi:hypothetical protein FQN50_000382 [Emmonsiellopsis sp. PD_5]|nr:hypothetical protein FQN50_000382 [Emmonsiellopsis sp. PD_5]